MPNETTIKKLAESIDVVLDAVHTLADHMDKRMDRIDQKLFALDRDQVNHDEFHLTLDKAKNDISSHIDSFVTLHQKVDLETVALRSRCDRIEAKLDKHGIA